MILVYNCITDTDAVLIVVYRFLIVASQSKSPLGDLGANVLESSPPTP